MQGWGPELCARRPDITMAMVDAFLTNMYRARADFVYTVTRDFVRTCQTPILVLPDDVPAQPSGYRPEMPGLSYNNNMKGWGPELCARRPDITMAMVDTFLPTCTAVLAPISCTP